MRERRWRRDLIRVRARVRVLGDGIGRCGCWCCCWVHCVWGLDWVWRGCWILRHLAVVRGGTGGQFMTELGFFAELDEGRKVGKREKSNFCSFSIFFFFY